MQNHQPPVPANIPQYIYPEDEISLLKQEKRLVFAYVQVQAG
jgi:hypothetical protein